MTRRALRPLVIVLAIFVGVILVGAIAIKLLVDPNDYRDRIEQMAEAATGRKLELRGDLRLALWPRLAVRTGPVSLANERGFGNEPMVAAQDARVDVRIWPLLSRRLEIGRIEIDAPRILLQVDRAGRDNWNSLVEKRSTEPPAAEDRSGVRSTAIAGLRIRDGELTYDDRRSGSRYVLSDLSLDVGALGSSAPVPIETSFALASAPGQAPRRVDLEARVEQSSPTGWTIRKLVGQLGADSKGEQGPAISCEVPELTYDTEKHALTVPELALTVAGARLAGSLSGTVGEPATALAGGLRLEPTKPRELLRALGVAVPATRDPQTLQSLQFESKLAYGVRGLALDAINGKLDGTAFRGAVRLAPGAGSGFDFQLDLDEIDVDRYLPPDEAAAESKSAAASKTREKPSTLRATGRVTAKRLRAYGLDMRNVQAAVRMADGRLRLEPFQARVFDGEAITRLTYDASQATPRLDVDLRVSRVKIAPLLKQFLHDDRLSGRGSLTARLHGRGASSDALITSLSGPFEVNLVDGAYAGVDLWYEIERALTLAQGRTPSARGGAPSTPFDRFAATGQLAGTVLKLQRFDLANAFLDARGRGDVDYKKATCDLDLVARLSKAPAGSVAGLELDRLTGVDIGVTVSGPLGDPKVRPDVGSLLEAAAKQRLKKEGKKVEKKLKEQVEEQLRGLFGQ